MQVVLVLLAVASALGCQAELSSSPGDAHTPSFAVSMCEGDLGHEGVCMGAADAVAVSPTRGERADALVLLVALVSTVAIVHAAAGANRSSRSRTGLPPWAAQRLVTGRHRLVAVGISRI